MSFAGTSSARARRRRETSARSMVGARARARTVVVVGDVARASSVSSSSSVCGSRTSRVGRSRRGRGGGGATTTTMATATAAAATRGGKRAGDRFVEHELAGYKIEGVSVGGQETSIVLPQLKVAFDSGRCPQRCVYADVMCLSHTHMDHVGGCGMYIATRGLLSLEPPTVLLPRERAGAFSTFIESLRALDDSELRHEAIGMVPGERYKMSKLFEIAPFKTTHPVPSQGYIVYGTKHKLKARYAGLDGKAIKQLRDEGEEVTDKIEVPQVAFTGDTTADWVDDPANADALRAKLLIMECTFIDDSVSKEDAERFGHTHIDDIVARADKFAENEAILLIHFSARYKAEDVREALKAKLPKELYEKCTPMLVGYD